MAADHSIQQGDLFATNNQKACKVCREVKPVEGFYKSTRGEKFGVSSCCKACRAAYAKRRREKHPGKNRRQSQQYKFKSRYGITVEKFEEMEVEQGHVCAICNRPEKTYLRKQGVQRNLHVDHNHDTGGIRGLLCKMCNTGIGCFYEDPEFLRRAANYLERHQTDSGSNPT